MSKSVKLNGSQIRERRKSMGLSQRAFLRHLVDVVLSSNNELAIQWVQRLTNSSKPTPITVTTLSNIERGKHKVSMAIARFIAIGMQKEIDDIREDFPSDPVIDRSKIESDYYLVPSILTGHMLYEGPDEQESVELDEIIARRFSDGASTVLGYGTIEEYQLYRLVNRWVGGGADELLAWGGIDPNTALFIYEPEFGLRIGPKGRALLVVMTSGSRIRLEFKKSRTGSLGVPSTLRYSEGVGWRKVET